jgi:hypothetical protein
MPGAWTVQVLLLTHVLFGTMVILTALWVFVDTLNVTPATVRRIRRASLASASSMWLATLVGGYWYVVFYGFDKPLILAGPWPVAHTFVMEVKEHAALLLLLMASYMPIAAGANLDTNRSARALVLWLAGLIVAGGLALDGAGALVATAAKLVAR